MLLIQRKKKSEQAGKGLGEDCSIRQSEKARLTEKMTLNIIEIK